VNVVPTFNVTLAVFVTEAAVMEIVPVHVVPAVRPVALTETVKALAVELAVNAPVGVSVSQLFPVQVCWENWAVALTLDGDVTVSGCVAGFAPPATALNVNEVALSVSPPVVDPPVTSSVTL